MDAVLDRDSGQTMDRVAWMQWMLKHSADKTDAICKDENIGASPPAHSKRMLRNSSLVEFMERIDGCAVLTDALWEASMPVCEISHAEMRYPVQDPTSNITYERDSILKWIAMHGTSPRTRLPLLPEMLVPNHALRRLSEARHKHMARQAAVRAYSATSVA